MSHLLSQKVCGQLCENMCGKTTTEGLKEKAPSKKNTKLTVCPECDFSFSKIEKVIDASTSFSYEKVTFKIFLSSGMFQQLAKLEIADLAIFVLVCSLDELTHISLGSQRGTQLVRIDVPIAILVEVRKRKLLQVISLGNVLPHRGGAFGGMIIVVPPLVPHVPAGIKCIPPNIFVRAG